MAVGQYHYRRIYGWEFRPRQKSGDLEGFLEEAEKLKIGQKSSDLSEYNIFVSGYLSVERLTKVRMPNIRSLLKTKNGFICIAGGEEKRILHLNNIDHK